jgi:5-bromo-4-chloroindolyl phosphate hydrolysis protein
MHLSIYVDITKGGVVMVQIGISIVVSFVIFLVFNFLLKINMIIAILLSILAYIALSLVFKPEKLYGIDLGDMDEELAEQLKNVIDEGYGKVNNIKKLSDDIKKISMKNKANEICDVCDKIFGYLKKNPTNVSSVRKLLNYYLDAVISILDKYINISSQGASSENIENSLEKVEEIFDSVKKAFVAQQEKLLANEIDELNVEISVLKDTMKSEGLWDEKK